MSAEKVRSPTWGGKREGAGRKKTGRKVGGPHRRRPPLLGQHPVHVVLRTARWVPTLREGRVYRALRPVLARYLADASFRVIHISMQTNHLHLLVEASDRRALSRGMQSFTINAARAINAARRARGKVFAFRYHATQIATPRQARNSLAYVLNNWRRHRQDVLSARTLAAKLDPYSSAVSFPGWKTRIPFEIPAGYVPLGVSAPRTALLATTWRRYGPIDPFEVPGPFEAR